MTDRRVATAMNMAVRQRNYRRARDRALVKLAQLHPEIYQGLLEKEKASDEQLGKKWIDITGNTTVNNLDTRADGSLTRGKASNNSAYKGNAGGEA
jgi:hypothetical protein